MDPPEAILKKRNDNGEKVKRRRRRTDMEKIENKKSLQVSFSKRRKGLFRKAEELSILCGVEVAVIAFSPAGKAFTFGNAGSAIDRLSAAHDDQKKNKTEEEVAENRKVSDGGMGSEELLDQSSMMGDDDLDQWLKNLMKDDIAWADSCFG